MSLSGKVAVVTGSTSGIGLGIARALAGEGAAILLNGFGDPAQIAGLRAELGDAHGVRVAYSDADISQPAQAQAMMAQAETDLGGLHILVNNAGVQHVAPIEDFPDAQWDRVIGINLSGVFHCTKAAIPRLRRAGWGRIVNIASAHGLVASAHKAAYVAAKHGVLGLTKVAALELAGSGVTVNAICPGWVRTPLVEQQLHARAEREGRGIEAVTHDLLAEKQPLLEFTTPEQIGALAVFLCSDAARTITGVPLSIDGGWVAQ
jgi:3-hydroxybutyrate dehydrogenase